MNLTDYVYGTHYIRLFEEDFKSKERFEQYAAYMCQNNNGYIEIPVDCDRALKLAEGGDHDA